MKKILIMCFAITFIFFTVYTFAQKGNDTGTLKIFVNGFANNNGKAMIALCSSEECYKDTSMAFKKDMTDIKDKKTEWLINELPYGTYSISIFHDENGNNKLDKNAIGVPKEDYGFSNNARGLFGPPDYEDVKFIFDKKNMTITITVN